MLVAADTNVAVRLLVSDDLAQQRAVVARLERIQARGGHILMTNVVLAEVAWVLESAYGYPRADVLRAITTLVTTTPFTADDPGVVADALVAAASGAADFADYLVLAASRARGATTLLTFDKRLLRHRGCERP